MLFVNDHYRAYELKYKAQSSAYIVASIIQQITNTRANKQLTANDLKHIAYASCLNLFHTNSMFEPWPLGIYYCVDFYWVKRINSDKYQYQVCWVPFITNSPHSPNELLGGVNGVTTMNKTQVASLHPDLICHNDGDERLLIKIFYRKINFDKRKLGFFLLDPTTYTIYDQIVQPTLVIAPKPGLFPIS